MAGGKKYSWSRPFGISAQVVGEFFYGLPERTPEAFIQASKRRSAPTHSLFEWDDNKAAAEFRLVQARIIVSSLQVEIISVKGKTEHVRAYIGMSERGRYVPTLEASAEEITDAEQDCVNEMRRFKARWRALQMVREVIASMDAVEARVARKRRKAA
jgi:hypothetical protein